MAYYDTIAKRWHEITGYRGGPFKRLVLNDYLLERVERIDNKAILELGAGNGYFLPMLLQRFAGQEPARVVVTDISRKLLKIAEREFHLPDIDYQHLDIRSQFPFSSEAFDLVVATMVFNELTNAGIKRGIGEIRRVLNKEGELLLTVAHPSFIESLSRRGELRRNRAGLWTMPGTGGLRLPVVKRSREMYENLLERAGFYFEANDVSPNEQVLKEKPGLKTAGNVPLALVFLCRKRENSHPAP